MGDAFRWWLTLEFFWLLGLPFLGFAFPGLRDRGAAYARVGGIILVAYCTWVLSHVGPFFGRTTLYAWFVLLGVVAFGLFWRDREKWLAYFRSPKEVLLSEIVFHLAFLALAFVRAYNPEIEGMWKGGGSEKYMDLNFVNSILTSSEFPPRDNWLAGETINYYYYGYYLCAVMIHLTGVLPHVGYNLMVVTVYALAIQGLWGLLRNMGCQWFFCLFGVFVAYFATNFKAPWLGRTLGEHDSIWVLWRSSRVIDLPWDGTINEYPWFSFLWSDLHGHLSAFPLQMAVIGMGYGAALSLAKSSIPRALVGTLLLSLTYGALAVANAWDLPAFAIVVVFAPFAAASFRDHPQALLAGLGGLLVGVIVAASSRLAVPETLCLMVLLALAIGALVRGQGALVWVMAGRAILGVAAVLGALTFFYDPFFSSFMAPTAGVNFVPWNQRTGIDLLFLIFGGFFLLLLAPLIAKSVGAFVALRAGVSSDSPTRRAVVAAVLALLVAGWLGGAIYLGRGFNATTVTIPADAREVVPASISADDKKWIEDKLPEVSPTLTGYLVAQDQKAWGNIAQKAAPFLIPTLLLLALVWVVKGWSRIGDAHPEDHGACGRYAAMMLVLGLGLMAGCEFVAIPDFYGESNLRMNTVFKFHLQAWVVLSVALVYLVDRFLGAQWEFWNRTDRLSQVMGGVGFTVQVLLLIGVLGWTGYGSWKVMAAKASNFENPPTLDGLAYAIPDEQGRTRAGGSWDRSMHSDDAKAVLWLLTLQRAEFDPDRRILEAPGGPYSNYGRVSAFSGITTIAGVPHHEGIWRRGVEGAKEEIESRERDVEAIYREPNFKRSKELIDQYGVTHVFWGNIEKNKYGAGAGRKFAKYMQELKRFGDTVIYSGYTDAPIQDEKTLRDLPPQPLAASQAISDPTHPFVEPRGVAVGPDGAIYVCNSKQGRIECFTADGVWARSIGAPGELSPEYSGCGGVAVGTDGTVYVADTWNHRIAVFNPDGTFARKIEAGFWGPRDIAVFGELLVAADTGNHRLVVLGPEGNELRTIGKKGSLTGEFIEPVGLAATADRLYVADVGNVRVQAFNRNFQPEFEFPVLGWEDQVGTEAYLAIDGAGAVWATDSGSNRIQQFSATGDQIAVFGPATTGQGLLNRPKGIAWGLGKLVVSDFANNRVLVVPQP